MINYIYSVYYITYKYLNSENIYNKYVDFKELEEYKSFNIFLEILDIKQLSNEEIQSLKWKTKELKQKGLLNNKSEYTFKIS